MPNFQPSQFFDLLHFPHASLFENCGEVWLALKNISPYLKQQKHRIEIEIPKSVYLDKADLISIGKGSVIEPGAYIRGPCIIGENCTIRHGAYIRGDVIAGNRCVIGHTTEVKGAIFLNDAHAAHFAYVGDSILGNRVNLGAGTKCANLKLNDTPVTLHIGGQEFQTGLRKFGAIIGDGSQIGCNAVTNPGVIIGKNTFCYPGINVNGFIPENSIVRSTERIMVTKKS